MHEWCINSLVDRTANLLGALALLVGDALADEAERVRGRSGAAGAAIAVLAQEPGLGIEALRRPLRLSQSAAVRVVDALVADGLATREKGKDARSVAVHLTEAGTREALAVLDARAAALDAVLAGLTPAQRSALGDLLDATLRTATTDRRHADAVCRLCDLDFCPLETCPVEQAAPRGS